MNLILAILAGLVSFSERLLVAWADFGPQEVWPAARAATDFTNLKYRVVRFDAAGTCNIASNNLSSDAFELAAGVIQNNPNSGQAATIAFNGRSKAWAGAAVAARELITHNASGKVIEAVSGSTVIGRALETAAATDDLISVQLFPPVRWGSVA